MNGLIAGGMGGLGARNARALFDLARSVSTGAAQDCRGYHMTFTGSPELVEYAENAPLRRR